MIYKAAKKTIHKPSLDHYMIVTKVGMTLGPSIRETDKSQGDTETERQKIWMQLQATEISPTARKPGCITEIDIWPAYLIKG